MPVKVRVQDFQSIKDATVEVDRFTVITGGNNSGKTALQRAIRGVFQNTGGTAFVREGSKKTKVLVDFGPDGTVEWSKGLSKRDRPTYVVNGGDPIHPGSAVPDEVAAFGVVPISAGGQEVWPTIAPQFSGQIFLLDRPGSALAEAVADVERVTQLNGALRKSESDRRQAAAALKVRQADLVTQEEDAKAFDGLDGAVEAVDALAAKQEDVRNVARAVIGLHQLRDKLNEAKKDAEFYAPVAAITLPTPFDVLDMRDELQGLLGLRDRLADAKTEEAKYAGIGSVLVVADEKPATRLRAALAVLKGLQERLRTTRQRVVERSDELEEAEAELLEASSAASSVLSELGQCPLCESVIATDQGGSP